MPPASYFFQRISAPPTEGDAVDISDLEYVLAVQARAREIAISVRSRVSAESEDTNGFVEDSASSDSAAVEVDGCVVTPHIAVSNGSCIHAKSVKNWFFFHADIAQW
jgi:hypothetical protein